MPANKRTYVGRIYTGRDETGKELYDWVGRFPDEKARDEAVMRRRIEREAEAAQAKRPAGERITCDQYVTRYLDWYESERKGSSFDTARQQLKMFRDEFGSRSVGSIERAEAIDWAKTVPAGCVSRVGALFSRAVDEEIVERNPFRNLGGKRSRGRADLAPPTVKELDRLLDACSAMGDYAEQMRALIVVGAYTGLRPSELYELRWFDIDLAANRIHCARRLYRGTVDTPKNGAAKTVALPPPARDVLLRQPTRAGELVFLSKQGKRLQASTVCQYWAIVRAAAGLDSSYDLYRCTKHLAVHRLYGLGLSKRAIAAQMGWSEAAVDSLLRLYGHADVLALAEVDALYADPSDAIPTHEDTSAAS